MSIRIITVILSVCVKFSNAATGRGQRFITPPIPRGPVDHYGQSLLPYGSYRDQDQFDMLMTGPDAHSGRSIQGRRHVAGKLRQRFTSSPTSSIEFANPAAMAFESRPLSPTSLDIERRKSLSRQYILDNYHHGVRTRRDSLEGIIPDGHTSTMAQLRLSPDFQNFNHHPGSRVHTPDYLVDSLSPTSKSFQDRIDRFSPTAVHNPRSPSDFMLDRDNLALSDASGSSSIPLSSFSATAATSETTQLVSPTAIRVPRRPKFEKGGSATNDKSKFVAMSLLYQRETQKPDWLNTLKTLKEAAKNNGSLKNIENEADKWMGKSEE